MSERKHEEEHLHIDQRVEGAERQLFWRYFVSRVLRLSLILLRQDIPDMTVGLVLPLQGTDVSTSVRHTEELPRVGESLIAWLERNHSFYAFLDPAPSFEYSSDFRVLPLQVGKEDAPLEDAPKDNTLIVVQRQARPLAFSMPIVETIRRLLAPLYEHAQEHQAYFGPGMRDFLDPTTDFYSGTNPSDSVLNGLADMAVRFGGWSADGLPRWRFCCILLPTDTVRPLQQRSLIVRAQSKDAPHKIGVTTVFVDDAVIGLSLRAFLSSNIIYRSEIATEDATIVHRGLEGPIRSAIAVPVGGENGQALAVLYVVSDEPNAFSQDDQRMLRIIGVMVEELLMRYRIRPLITEKLVNLMRNPSVVDTLFQDFASENDFVSDVEKLMIDIKTDMKEKRQRAGKEEGPLSEMDTAQTTKQSSEEVVSFIAIDMDNQGSFANKYGDQMTRNLNREIGLRIQGHFRASVRKADACRLYHAYADRFYLMMKGFSLEEARENAEQLRKTLGVSYQIDALRVSMDQPMLPDRKVALPGVTVRLGVTTYTYQILEQHLQRYPDATAVTEMSAIIMCTLDEILKSGRDEGGNMVMFWEPKVEGFVRWSLPREG